MIPTFAIGRRDNWPLRQIDAMHRLRASVFHDRLGWEVQVLDGWEIDRHDSDAAHYMLVFHDAVLAGCWRLLPTTGDYMLKDDFPELLDGAPAPRVADVWELSRFVIDSRNVAPGTFADSTIGAMQEVVRFALEQGIARYVTVTTVAMERMLRRTGLVLSRLGAARRIGRELTVALDIPMNQAAADTLVRARRAAAASAEQAIASTAPVDG